MPRYRFSNGVDVITGTGDPEGAVVANVGSIFLDDASGDLYAKTSGSGDTGWDAVGGGGSGSAITELTGDVTATGPGSVAATIAAGAVTYAKIQNVSAASRVLARKTAGAGSVEEATLSEVLDFVGSAAQGDILYRGAAGWARLAAGVSGRFLKTLGSGADPIWDSVAINPAATYGVVTVPFTRAQAIALAATPLTLLAAQGAGTIIVPIKIVLVSNYTTAFAASGTLQVRYAGDSLNLLSVGTPWNSSANRQVMTSNVAASQSYNLASPVHINNDVNLISTSAPSGGAVGDTFAAIMSYQLVSSV